MLRLVWSMVRDASDLRIAYVVRNEGSAAVIVTDSLVYQRVVSPLLVVVENDQQPSTVSFKRGFVASRNKWFVPPPMPTAISLAPGAELNHEVRVPWPLTAFHNTDQDVVPLDAGITHAVLEIGWIDHPEAHLQRRAIAENTFVETASHWVAQRWLRGERLPLPGA